jgi:hypothetical protein
LSPTDSIDDFHPISAQFNSDTNFYLRSCDDELGCGYLNTFGDTMIPIGTYLAASKDTFQNFAIVLTQDYEWIGIDKQENKLFDIFIFEQGPDYVKEGLFRIVKGDKIGYANEQGEIIIQPIYSCAVPFKDGLATVAMNCSKIQNDPEHWSWDSDEWFYIDKEGNRVEGVAE